ncbi:hypothetical protein [Nostoc sp.]|uniref:hypothetical protein n=1 Tax=Nostoc sp. TaxID=1180 RepID=UPI002FF629CA
MQKYNEARQFRETLDSRQQLIQLWVNRQKGNPVNMTLCCSLEDWGFLPSSSSGKGDSTVRTLISQI